MTTQRVQTVGPFGAIRLEPGVEVPERFTAQPIKAPLGIGPDRDQAGIPQHLQVAGNARLAHAEKLNELADRALLGANRVQDATSSRLHDGFEDGGRDHRFNIVIHVYKRKGMFAGSFGGGANTP